MYDLLVLQQSQEFLCPKQGSKMLLIASSYLERLIETQYWSLGIFSVSKLLVIHVTFYQGVEVEIRSYIVHVGLEEEKVDKKRQ